MPYASSGVIPAVKCPTRDIVISSSASLKYHIEPLQQKEGGEGRQDTPSKRGKAVRLEDVGGGARGGSDSKFWSCLVSPWRWRPARRRQGGQQLLGSAVDPDVETVATLSALACELFAATEPPYRRRRRRRGSSAALDQL